MVKSVHSHLLGILAVFLTIVLYDAMGGGGHAAEMTLVVMLSRESRMNAIPGLGDCAATSPTGNLREHIVYGAIGRCAHSFFLFFPDC